MPVMYTDLGNHRTGAALIFGLYNRQASISFLSPLPSSSWPICRSTPLNLVLLVLLTHYSFLSSPSHQYLPPHSQYYPSAAVPNNGPIHIVQPTTRPDIAARKRPKYTRSKTGCLTCRVKKIKVCFSLSQICCSTKLTFSSVRRDQTSLYAMHPWVS